MGWDSISGITPVLTFDIGHASTGIRLSSKYLNKLGILYARFDLIEKAVEQFSRALQAQEYVPALVNMGNIQYIEELWEEALEYYERAERQKPDSPAVLLGLARANHELENYGIVRKAYDKLKTVSPDMADRFAYLEFRGDEAARAAESSGIRDVIIWEEEE